MILAVAVPEKRELVIVAADSLTHQRKFLTNVESENPELIQDTDFSRFLIDTDLSKFKLAPTILEFPDTESLDGFVAENNIELTTFANAHGRQRRMLYLEDFNSDTGGATIGELYGLDKHDPYDRRTDEEKAEAEKHRQKMSEKRKSGEITEDSWGAPKSKGKPNPDELDLSGEDIGDNVRIRKVEIERNADGTVTIKRVIVDKGTSANSYHVSIFDDEGNASKVLADYTPILKAAGLAETNVSLGIDYEAHEDGGIILELHGAATVRMRDALTACGRQYVMNRMVEEQTADNPDNEYRISHDDMVPIYFRVDVSDKQVADIMPLLENEEKTLPYRTNDVGADCWLAYVRERWADDAVEVCLKNGIAAKTVAVDPEGEAIVEEGAGATVIDTGAAAMEPPAPWNDRAQDYYAMPEEERKMAITGRFLLYSMRDYSLPNKIIVHITPMTYFNEHGKMWTGDLPIDHLIPDNFQKFGDEVGVYQCKSLDMNTADFLIGNNAGMRESLGLRAYLNTTREAE